MNSGMAVYDGSKDNTLRDWTLIPPKDQKKINFGRFSRRRVQEFDNSSADVVPSGVDEGKRECVALLAKHFKISEEQAGEDYEHLTRRHFDAAARDEPARSSPRLTVPERPVAEFGGKPAEVYKYLIDTYAPREGGEPLTLSYLHQHNKNAVKAFRSRRRTEPVPAELRGILTDESWGKRTTALLDEFGIDLSTEYARERAKKLMGAIGYALYRS